MQREEQDGSEEGIEKQYISMTIKYAPAVLCLGLFSLSFPLNFLFHSTNSQNIQFIYSPSKLFTFHLTATHSSAPSHPPPLPSPCPFPPSLHN